MTGPIDISQDARIYKPAKTGMQSGFANTKAVVLVRRKVAKSVASAR